MIVSIESFNAYSGNYEDSNEAVFCKKTFLRSSEEIVKDYLGFDPQLKEYTEELAGNLRRGLWLGSRNVLEVTSVYLNGHELPLDEYRLKGDKLFSTAKSQGPFTHGFFTVTYTAGWSDENMPSVIVLSILRLATLMLTEGNGNIGLTGKSFTDNSRTFVNYSNYRKYLQPLDGFRIMRF